MPGKNPDPADTLDIIEVIRETFHRDLAPEVGKAIAVEVAKIIPNASAGSYETRSLPEVTTPTLLLGQDRQRTRAVVSGNVTAGWVIGTFSELSGIPTGQALPFTALGGFPVGTQYVGGSLEIFTTEAVYAVYVGQSTSNNRIYTWIERATA